jgi:predicted DNA-binding WGR domain protein
MTPPLRHVRARQGCRRRWAARSCFHTFSSQDDTGNGIKQGRRIAAIGESWYAECLFPEPVDAKHYTALMSEKQREDVPAEELAQFQHYVRFISQDAAKNRQRFYLLSWQPTLEGDTALVCTWGRLGTLGRSRTIFYPERAQVQDKLVRLIQRRLQRGYQIAAWQ